jgi:predicted dehydrogenase
MVDEGLIGEKLHSISVLCRMGDGWGENAYIPRQPYFREYPRLFIYETGVHFIDTFRYIGGEIKRVTAWLRRLNPVIKGEDCVHVALEFASGALGVMDANRYNEPDCPLPDARYTFGKFLFEGNEGSIRLYLNGRITLQRLGEGEKEVQYVHSHVDFAGDCCFTTQRHFVERIIDGREFETNGTDYLKTLAVQEAVYESDLKHQPIDIG